MNEDTKNVKNKIGFLERVKISVLKLENYGMFLTEKLSVAFKYFFLLLLIISIIIGLVVTYKFVQVLNKGFNYINNEMPDFSFNENKLSSSKTEAYDWDYNFRLIIDTDENITEDQINSYKEKNYDNEYGLLLLNKKCILIIGDVEQEYPYKDLVDVYQLNITNKQDLVLYMQQNVNNSLFAVVFIGYSLMSYINSIILTLSHVCFLAILGYIISKLFLKPNLKMAPMISLAIYSLTLSNIILCVYSCVNIITGFYIGMIDQIYYLIAVVYMIAAIFMIKYDLIKQTEELSKIYEVHEETKKEFEDNNDPEEKDKKKEKKKDKEDKKDEEDGSDSDELENKEPDGSEI